MQYTRRQQYKEGAGHSRWFCRATKEKDITCENAIFTEEQLMRICARVLGMEVFDENEFLNRVRHMTVTPDGMPEAQASAGEMRISPDMRKRWEPTNRRSLPYEKERRNGAAHPSMTGWLADTVHLHVKPDDISWLE